MALQIKDANIELHVHPFLGRNTIVDVVEAMDKKNLYILALSSLDATLYPYVRQEVAGFYDNIIHDQAGIRLPDGKYLLNAREYNTKENLHLLTVGGSVEGVTPQTEIREIIDKALEKGALPVLDHPYVDNVETNTAGHISLEKEYELEKICREYSDEIALEWNAHCVPWMRRVLRIILNLRGYEILYHDVNKKVEELSDRLKEEGYNLPVLADTDLHARNRSIFQLWDSKIHN